MSRNPSALASLTANYTDSENEDGNNSDDESHHTDDSNESQVIIPSKPSTPIKVRSTPSTPTKIEAKSGLRLVSYHDDTVISDEENVSPPNEIAEKMDFEEAGEEEKHENYEESEGIENKIKKEKSIEYGFPLPSEPKGKCPAELQDKISKLYEKMKTNNMDMNKIIQERKEFRNPSIYEKLIQFCDIDELGTNYPPELYDPMQWGKDSFYEELAKVQKTEMEKREKDFAKSETGQAPARKAEEDAKKRKSKWDQPAPSASGPQTTSIIKASGLITTSITGTKGTVISAFGSLPKKPKV